jgi:hypothetical protein
MGLPRKKQGFKPPAAETHYITQSSKNYVFKNGI